jgi:lipoate-protein ligase A
MLRQWHLSVDPPTIGARNMATDEAILTAVSQHNVAPTLRLYRWTPPCLSLGYGQPSADVDPDRLAERGWHWVRRITGGRSILHTDELTYSLSLPMNDPLAAGGIVESYRRISRALMRGLELLGMIPQADKMADGVKGNGPVCFEVPSHYEITTGDGRKLVGSAQVRRRDALLQHGTLPLTGDLARICDVLRFDSEEERDAARRKVRDRAATLADALNHEVDWETAAQAIAQGFAETFEVDFLPPPPIDSAEVDRLIEAIYANHAWITRH